LFALLAALLTSRWSSMTTGERDQLAELILVLLPRAEPQDRRHLLADLAGRSDLPKVLQPLVAPTTDLAPVSSNGAAAAALPELKSARGKPISITLRQPQVFSRPAASKDAASASPVNGPQHPTSQRPDHPALLEATDLEALPGLAQADQHVLSSDEAGADQLCAPVSAALTAPATQPPEEALPPLTGPRENPHRLTTGLLAEALARGDLARFEVMLAHLTRLRAPLLRRLLRDSGNEGFAILEKSLGINEGEFRQHWQDWRQQMFNLDPYGGQPDRRESKRISVFFANLTDGQVDRLVERWRSDGARLFAGGEQPA
jgi:hypothetical protein